MPAAAKSESAGGSGGSASAPAAAEAATSAAAAPAEHRTSIASTGKRKPRQVVMGESYDKSGEKFVLKTYPKSPESK